MKRSLAHGAGYVIVDHRESPGLTPADVAHVPGAAAVAGGAVLERDVMTCSHCQRGVLLNPGRVRARAVCPKCHAYLCDGCEAIRVAAGGTCVPFAQVLERASAVAERFVAQPDHPEAAGVNDLAVLAAPAAPRIIVPGGGS